MQVKHFYTGLQIAIDAVMLPATISLQRFLTGNI